MQEDPNKTRPASGLHLIALSITAFIAVPVNGLILAISASMLWRWFLFPIHVDPGIPAWFGAINLFALLTRPRGSSTDRAHLSHGQIITGVFVTLFSSIVTLAIAFAVGTCFHWIP